MKHPLLITALLCFFLKGYVQLDIPFKWAKTISVEKNPYYRSILMDVKNDDIGNVFICGIFSDTIDFDPGITVYKMDTTQGKIFVVKLDSAGNFKWGRNFGDAYNVFLNIDNEGNVLCCGASKGDKDFDAGPGIIKVPDQSGFLVKWQTDGALLWIRDIRRTYPEPGMVSGGFGLAGVTSDSAGNIYATGNFCGTIDLDPGPSEWKASCGDCRSAGGTFLVKLDKNGNFRKATLLSCPGIGYGYYGWGYGNDNRICLDSKNNIYYIGSFTGNVDFDPGPADSMMSTTTGAIEGFICKIDSSFKLKWAKRFPGPVVWPDNILADDTDNIFVSGVFDETMDIDPTRFVYILNVKAGEKQNSFILKMDSSGAFRWGKGISCKETSYYYNSWGSLRIDSRGSLYMVASVKDSIFLYDRSSRKLITESKELSTALMKISSAGDLKGGRVVLDSVNVNNYYQFNLDKQDNVFLAGNFTDTLDADPGPGVKLFISDKSYSMFVIKLGPAIPVKLNEPVMPENCLVFPNPTQGPLTLTIEGFKNQATITVFNLQGKQILSRTTNESQAALDLSMYPAGVYLIKVSDKERETYIKVLKQ